MLRVERDLENPIVGDRWLVELTHRESRAQYHVVPLCSTQSFNQKPDRKSGDRSRRNAPVLMRDSTNQQLVLIEETVVLVRNSPLGFPETQRQNNPEAGIGSAHNRRTNEEPT